MTRLFLAIQRGPKGPAPVLYRDEFNPSAFDRSITDYACELLERYHGLTLVDLETLFWAWRNAGTLPANLAAMRRK